MARRTSCRDLAFVTSGPGTPPCRVTRVLQAPTEGPTLPSPGADVGAHCCDVCPGPHSAGREGRDCLSLPLGGQILSLALRVLTSTPVTAKAPLFAEVGFKPMTRSFPPCNHTGGDSSVVPPLGLPGPRTERTGLGLDPCAFAGPHLHISRRPGLLPLLTQARPHSAGLTSP